eukprot:TRINITY_DN5039_c0_g1_i1.p1 TRINITY_DN5039_c0_g1~~TRINITY_DN5039_c0_g1_i1.p1  ORF type:complete len:425 (-),score=113.63 TRINITY_DN5039_c0_g1_i1:82-1356(-)
MVFNKLLVCFVLLGCISTAFGAAGLYNAKSDVIPLTQKNFAKQVFGSEHVWLVEFYAPWCGHCKQLAPEYDKAATNLKGIVKVGAINCDEEKELCGNFGVQGFPTIKLFPSELKEVPKKKGAFHKEPVDYQQARTAPALVSFATSHLPSKFITSVSEKNVDKFLEGELAKVLLFTNKGKTSDLYKALSIDFHNRLILGEVKHTDKQLVQKYNIQSFPTLLVIPTGKDEPVKFEGALKHEILQAFLEPYAKSIPKSESKHEEAEPKKAEKKEKVNEDDGKLLQVVDTSVFESRCGVLCAIAVLNEDSSSEEGEKEHQNYINTLTSVALKYKGKMPIVWLDVKDQPQFVKDLDIPQFYPGLVVLNPKKLRFSQFMGSYTESSISDFFDGVLMGKKRSVPIDKLPTFVKVESKPKPDQKEKPVKEEL